MPENPTDPNWGAPKTANPTDPNWGMPPADFKSSNERDASGNPVVRSALGTTTEPDVVTLRDLMNDPKDAIYRIGAIFKKDATDPKIILPLVASYFGPKLAGFAIPVAAKYAANLRGLTADVAPAIVKHGMTVAGGAVGGGPGAGLGRIVGDAIAERMGTRGPGYESVPGYPRGGATPTPETPPPPVAPPTTSTSMTPAPQPPMKVGLAQPSAPPVQSVAASAMADLELARAEVAAGRLPKTVLTAMEKFEAAKLARAQTPAATPAAPPVAAEQPTAAPVQAPAPVEPPSPVVAPAPAVPAVEAPTPRLSPQQTLNELAIAARRAKTVLSADDYDALKLAVADGTSPADAVSALVKSRIEANPAAELARRLGTPSDAERTFPPNKSGLPTKPPAASDAARFDAARGNPQSPEIPLELVKPTETKASIEKSRQTGPFLDEGLWHILKNDGSVSKNGWLSYGEMAAHANKQYGVGNWSYEWHPSKVN